jgi:hypothetical protein
MTLKPSKLRPGLLVSLKTSVKGNVSYRKQEIERDHAIDDQARRAKWETTRTIANAEEHAEATVVRGKARYQIARVCADTAFGLLCPEANREELATAIDDARAMIEAFNARATITRLDLYAIIGVVAADDAEAARAVSAEMRELVAEMAAGVESLNPDKIREAANRARALGKILSADGKARVQEAIDSARKAATAIAKAAQAGETAATAVSQAALDKLESARTAFLDMDDNGELVDQAPQAPGRAIDFEPGVELAADVAPAPAPAVLDLF